MSYNSSKIATMYDLQREQFIVRERIKLRQQSLKNKMYEIPGELAAAGVNSFIPRILRGKVTNAALNTGKKVINTIFAPDNTTTRTLIGEGAKSVGVLKGLKSLWNLVRRR